MKSRILFFFLMIFFCSNLAFAYDTDKLEADFKEMIKLGNRVYKSSIKASRVLSDTLVKDGQPNNSISAEELPAVQQQLTAEDGDKIELLVSEMQAGNLDEYAPKPNNFNTAALEKLISIKRKGGKGKPQVNKVASVKVARNDKKAVQESDDLIKLF